MEWRRPAVRRRPHSDLSDILAGTGYFGQFGGYTAAYPNLRKNDPRYPTPEHLLSLVRIGNVDNVGEMTQVTDGSNLIKKALLEDDPRPLWLVTGGGTNTICAALSQVVNQYQNTPQWDAIRRHIIAKTHVYIILNQDNTLHDYLKPNWPDLDVILNRWQFFVLAYGWQTFATPEEQAYLSAPFMAQIAKGPILGTYPLVTPELLQWLSASGATFNLPIGSFLSEGDAPMYLNLLPVGLRSEENPTWGGWGGRFEQATNSGWSDVPADLINGSNTINDFPPNIPPHVTDSGSGSTSPLVQEGYPQGRWIPALQNDMLSRSQWQTLDYAHANHPPVVFVPRERQNISAAPGELVQLHGFAADPAYHNHADPDGKRLRTRACKITQYI